MIKLDISAAIRVTVETLLINYSNFVQKVSKIFLFVPLNYHNLCML